MHLCIAPDFKTSGGKGIRTRTWADPVLEFLVFHGLAVPPNCEPPDRRRHESDAVVCLQRDR
jgi:hypothetical protein